MTETTEPEVQVRVTWNTCDCEYTTKYCDEFHQRGTLIPVPMLEDPVAWFAAHDAEVAANALREAANAFETEIGQSDFRSASSRSGGNWTYAGEAWQHQGPYMDWLRNRADRIERDATNHKPNPELGSSEGSDR